MSKYVIAFFPRTNTKDIQDFRRTYDPKFELISPHITLVFPFPAPDHDQHLFTEIGDRLTKYKPFEVEVDGYNLDAEDDFLHLLVTKGREEMEAIHDDLYGGTLLPYWRKDLGYEPHMTIGVFADSAGILDQDKYSQAQENMKTRPLKASFSFDNVNIFKIEDPKKPRTVLKTFDL